MLAQTAWGGGGGTVFTSLEVFKSRGDMALRDVGSGRGGDGLDCMILEVFSSLPDPVIRYPLQIYHTAARVSAPLWSTQHSLPLSLPQP